MISQSFNISCSQPGMGQLRWILFAGGLLIGGRDADFVGLWISLVDHLVEYPQLNRYIILWLCTCGKVIATFLSSVVSHGKAGSFVP